MKDPAAALFAIQTASDNLLETVDSVAKSTGGDSATLSQEAQTTVRMFVAASALADSALNEGEETLVQMFIKWDRNAGDQSSFLRDYGNKWEAQREQVPAFFDSALKCDRENGTQNARAIMRELQLIGNNVSISDGQFAEAEQASVKGYIAFLENHLEATL